MIARSLVHRLIGRSSPVTHVALGTFCHVASALRDAGLRRWTGPFDWIFSTPAMISACLADDFAAFLDPANLASVPPAELAHGARRQGRHPVYEARYGLPPLFNHHDPAASASDARSFERAAGRMRAALGPGRSNVFYMMSEIRWPEGEVAELASRLGRAASRNTLAILTVEGGAADHAWTTAERQTEGCRVLDVDIRTHSRSTGIAFSDPRDAPFLDGVLREIAARRDRALPDGAGATGRPEAGPA